MKNSLLLLSVAAWALGNALLAAEPQGLEYHLSRIAGEKAARCGSFRRPPVSWPRGPDELSREESRTVAQCLTAARRQKRGFLFSVETPGADVSVAGGLVAGPSGAIRRFYYRIGCRPRRDDEAGPGPKCDEQFTTTACPLPKTAGALDPNMVCR